MKKQILVEIQVDDNDSQLCNVGCMGYYSTKHTATCEIFFSEALKVVGNNTHRCQPCLESHEKV